MNDIFLLYAPSAKDEVENFMDNISEVLNSHGVRMSSYDPRKDIFRNKSDCTKSRVLIAFFDSYFFHTDECLTLWESYLAEPSKSDTAQNVFPVLLNSTYIPDDKNNSRHYTPYQKALQKVGFYYANYDDAVKIEDGNFVGIYSKDAFPKSYKKLASEIIRSLDDIRKHDVTIGNELESGETSLIVESIENLEMGLIAKRYLSKSANKKFLDLPSDDKRKCGDVDEKINLKEFVNLAYPTGKRVVVCAIYSGGTVGMIRDIQADSITSLKQATPEELITNLPRLGDLEFDVHFYSYEKTIDSSNAGSENWVQLAEIIDNLSPLYQGFVIIHGANTLSYTASALSYMFDELNKPIILTGAELSLSDISREAETNVIKSLRLAANAAEEDSNIPEVCILYGMNLMRGNRATKKVALDTVEGFYSPNFPNLGVITNDRENLNYSVLKKTASDMHLHNEVAKAMIGDTKAKIVICDVYPDMPMDSFKNMCDPSIHGLILRTYGTGGVPDNDSIFMTHLDTLLAAQTVVVSLTQCPIGSIELRLFETNAQLFDKGVINGGDMTTEAAYCKLKYLFAKHGIKTKNTDDDFYTFEKRQLVEDEMMRDLVGELSMETHLIRFAGNTLSKGHVIDIRSDTFGSYDKRNLQGAVLRLENVQFPGQNDADNSDIDVEIRTMYSGTAELFGKCVKKHSDVTADIPINVNVDVLKSVKKYVSSSKNQNTLSLKICSNNHDIQYKSLTIVLLFGRIGS